MFKEGGRMKQISTETLKYMWRNRKNQLFMVVMILLMLFYTIFIVQDYNQHQDVDIDTLETEMRGNANQATHAEDQGWLEPSSYTGTTAYIEKIGEFGQQRELFTILKQGDIYRYLSSNYVALISGGSEEEPIGPAGISGLFYNLLGVDPIYQKQHRYITEIENLNFHIVHEITSLQQIHLFLLGAGPLILLSGLAFMISDIHTKDRSLSSQKLGMPLSWQKSLLSQSLAALAFVGMFYLVFLGLFYLINGILHGFGLFSYPISMGWNTIGEFLIRTIPYFFLLIMIFTRLNTLFSLWTRHPIITMILLLFIIFSSSIYMDSTSISEMGFNLGYLPISYISFGKIVSGQHHLQPIREGLTVYNSGLIVLAITLIIIEILVYFSSKKITRQKFMV